MDSKKQSFSVSMGKAAKRLTVAYFAVLLLFFGVSYLFGVYDNPTPASMALDGSVAAIVAAIALWCWWLSPKRIDVSGEWLTIVRRIGRKKIAVSDITYIERYGSMGSDTRVCGVGGVFGFTGWFRNKELGNYFAYVGDTKNAVLVQTRKRKYVVSCDRPDELVEALRKAAGLA